MRWFLTYHTYGTYKADGDRLTEWRRRQMTAAALMLNEDQRFTVLEAIRHVCAAQNWELVAAHVRSTHVHVVAGGNATPEQMIHRFKVAASQMLRAKGRVGIQQRIWAGSGYWRRLETERGLANAVHYVLDEQGEAMAVYVAGR